MAKKFDLSRRDFVKAMGSASLFLPMLHSVPARGQMAGAPLRVIFIMNRNGQWADNFYPAVTTTQVAANIFQAPLTSIAGDVAPLFGTAYNSLKGKMSILRGLDITGPVDHCRTSFLCAVTQGGAANSEGNRPRFGASADWLIERSPNFYATAPRIRTMRYSNDPGRGFSFSNVNGVISDPPYLNTDSGFFNNVFAGVSSGAPAAVDPVARKSFLIDKAIERLNVLRQNRRISTTDAQRLSDHADNLNDIKAGLTITAPVACTVPAMSFYANGQQRRKIYENVNNTIVAAFTCDISRIACMYIEDYDDLATEYSYFHDLSHRPRSAANIQESALRNKWIADRIAHLLQRLDTTIDVNGRPMLENTLVLWGSEICCKEDVESHRPESMPVMVAGWPGKFRMGSFIDYRQRPFVHVANRGDFPAIGRPYTQFLCSIMRAAGLQSSEFMPYGQNGYFGEYTPNQYNPDSYTPYAAMRNDNLPYFVL
ncbi:MAG TPA: DUF1552 domain-containing protein [Bdellovibrionales bacterium]|nr:DUF1552 domain-containing protein [Bdellovibrionales bacterium]